VSKDSGSVHSHQQSRALCNQAESTMGSTKPALHARCSPQLVCTLRECPQGQGHTGGPVPQVLPPVQQLPCCSGPQTSPAAHTHPQTSTGCWHAHCTFGQRTNAYDIVDAGCHCLSCRWTVKVLMLRECRAGLCHSVTMNKLLCTQLCMLVSADADHLCTVCPRQDCSSPK